MSDDHETYARPAKRARLDDSAAHTPSDAATPQATPGSALNAPSQVETDYEKEVRAGITEYRPTFYIPTKMTSYDRAQSRAVTVTPPPTTARNQEQSPLLRLPRELRDKIWYHVIGNNYISMKPYPQEHLACAEYPGCTTMPLIKLFALGSTCRQLHGETALLPFRLCAMDYGRLYSVAVFEWLGRLSGEQRAAITEMKMPVSALENPDIKDLLSTCHDLKCVKVYFSYFSLPRDKDMSKRRMKELLKLVESSFSDHIEVIVLGEILHSSTSASDTDLAKMIRKHGYRLLTAESLDTA
ncbi:hypothetical protein E8E13_003511 [Curvularia kusanoi]|uniref:Uncharacterized protein n=1 Tax=Curvularia kusanoi TaxID=90978 RepID=A0A9P4T752_CURKU|nr:hypothetical protein E8E13_003511 [Curvularia kusanoi]